MKKIAFVVQRYGENINGGAEYHCRVLAEHMTQCYEVDVLTSCALSYTPWDNYFEAGVERINGVNIHRFSVDKIRDAALYRDLTDRVKRGDESAEDDWIAECGPYCPSCIDYLRENSTKYEAIIFFTYAYYLTVAGLKLNLPNAILLPTAHDEPNIYMPIFKKVFKYPKAILFNSIEEKAFLLANFLEKDILSRLTCVGIDVPITEARDVFPQNLAQYKEDYILYLGRVSNGKNYQELNRYFIEYKNRNKNTLKMIIAGKIDDGMKIVSNKDIIFAGFVSDEERMSLLRNAKLLVLPSLYESLSLVILESMSVSRPVLVNGKCEVTKGQCIRSNAGLYYTNYFEFEKCLNYILENQEAYVQMCENGLKFVKEQYDWNFVVQNVSELVNELASTNINLLEDK